MNSFTITSPAFKEGDSIPPRFTADGEDLSPEIRLEGLPGETKSLALIMDDPDAPMGTWVHWVAWNFPAGTTVIGKNALPEAVIEGTNSWGRTGYGGPSPPPGTGIHHYIFKVFALDTTLDLPGTTDKEKLLAAMEGHIISQAQLVGTYTRDR